MKSRLPFSVVFILSLAITVFSQSAPLPSVFQSWNEVQIIKTLAKGKDAKSKPIEKLTATFNGTFRIGRKTFDFLDDRIGANLDYRLNRYFSFNATTLYRRDEFVKTAPHYETRVGIGATFSKTFHKFTFRDRNQIEHRFRNSRADLNVYRQRIQINHPLTFHKKEIFTPFISEEGFYDLKTKIWFRNEFYAGITRRLNKQTTLDVAYVRNDTRPVNVNGLNLILKIKLR